MAGAELYPAAPESDVESGFSVDDDPNVQVDLEATAVRKNTTSSWDSVKKMPTDNTELRNKARAARAAFVPPAVWVMVFGWSLAVCAGIVNAAAYRTWGAYVSHMTGATTAIGMRIEGVHRGRHHFFTLVEAVALVCSFLAGAFTCGILIDKNQVHFGGKAFYGVALVGNSFLLFLAVLLSDTPIVACCCVAAACGLQNAMCTSHFGAVVRTTHVTGTLTDIGSTLGRMAMIFLRKGCRCSMLNALELAEVAVDAKKLLVLLPMWVSYLVGTVFGAYLSSCLGVNTLLVPATLTFVVGTTYATMRDWLKEKLKRIEKERLDGDVAEVERALSRTRGLLQALRRESAGATTSRSASAVVIDLDHEVEQILEVVHQMEADIETLYSGDAAHDAFKHGASTAAC